MLIAFVLLGRNLEQRAKIKATSDMTGLLNVLPSKARLVVSEDSGESSSTVEVPSNSLSVGDQIIVLPGVSKLCFFFTLHCNLFGYLNLFTVELQLFLLESAILSISLFCYLQV